MYPWFVLLHPHSKMSSKTTCLSRKKIMWSTECIAALVSFIVLLIRNSLHDIFGFFLSNSPKPKEICLTVTEHQRRLLQNLTFCQLTNQLQVSSIKNIKKIETQQIRCYPHDLYILENMCPKKTQHDACSSWCWIRIAHSIMTYCYPSYKVHSAMIHGTNEVNSPS